MKNNRRVIAILGMHRSGTSAVAGTAVRLGAAGPRTPLDASDDNPSGFYESAAIVMQNHKMLLQANCAWNLCLHRDAFAISATAPAFSSAFTRVLAEEFGDAPLFVLKDPRLCMTFPAWLPLLRNGGIDISVVMVIRHPVEVARSLQIRNNLSPAESIAQWLHHILEAERATRGLPRAVLFFHDLMSNWRLSMLWAAHAAGIVWPNPVQAVGGQIDHFLADDLRHQRAAPNEGVALPKEIAPLVQATWDVVQQMRDNANDAGRLRILDAVRQQFAAWRQATYPSDLGIAWRQDQAGLPAHRGGPVGDGPVKPSHDEWERPDPCFTDSGH